MILLQLETAIAATAVHMFSQDTIICVDLFIYSLYFSPIHITIAGFDWAMFP